MEEWGNRRPGSAIRLSPSRNTRGNMTDAGSVMGRIFTHKHDHKTCKIYAEDKKAYFQAHPEKVPKEKRMNAWKRGQSAGGGSEGQGLGGDRIFRQIEEVADLLMRGMEALKALRNERTAPWPGNWQQDRAVVDGT